MLVGAGHPVIVESDLGAGAIEQSKRCIAQGSVHAEVCQRRADSADEDFLRRESRNNESADEDIVARLDSAAGGKVDQGVTSQWERFEGYRNVHITATDGDGLGRKIPEPTGGEVFLFAG